MNNESNIEIKKLLEELKDNRINLHDMLADLTEFRKNLDVILPKTTDFRQKHLIAERMKTITEIIKSELAVRGQIDSSIKMETDIRRKSTDEENDDRPSAIREYAKAMELFYNDKNLKENEENISIEDDRKEKE